MTQKAQVSIVILTKNGGELLKRSIELVNRQKIDLGYEVIIVDSGSTDGSLDFLKRYPIKLFNIKPDEFKFGPTRDFAFSKAEGDYIVTISQDVVPSGENWLAELIRPLRDNTADIVYAPCRIPDNTDTFFWETVGMFDFTSEWNNFAGKTGGKGLSCTNMAIKRSVWENTKFGDAPMSEDKALQKRAFEKGYKFIESKAAYAYHGHQYTLSSLIKRCENEGFGWRNLGEVYPFGQMIRDLVQKKWVYGMLVRGILNRKIRQPSEILFLFIRPICIYKGNRFNTSYKR